MTAESVTNPLPGQEPQLTPNALNVLRSRYLIKDQDGNCTETPGQLFNRTASLMAQAESRYGATAGQIRNWQKKYYELMAFVADLCKRTGFTFCQRLHILLWDNQRSR